MDKYFIKVFLILALALGVQIGNADECSFLSVDDAFKKSVIVVEAEKIYTGLSFDEFSEDFNRNLPASSYDLVSSWHKYRDSQKQVEFLIVNSLKGKHDRGDVIAIENNIVLKKLYNIGNKFILFLQDSPEGSYYLDTCIQIDLSRRYANINFEEYMYLEFDALVKKIEEKQINK